MPKNFLKAEWRKLILANYAAREEQLAPLLPAHTELDLFNGQLYVSLVGFMFLNTRILGVKVPFHVNFEEINLRFYVKRKENNEWKRGVVFIKEIVSKPAISLIANNFYNEKYATLPTRHSIIQENNRLEVSYGWKFKNKWNSIEATGLVPSGHMATESEEDFITQHFWGYNASNGGRTVEYEVSHPRWKSYRVEKYKIDCDFEGLYGSAFADLSNAVPLSVMLAEGSEIEVYNKRILTT